MIKTNNIEAAHYIGDPHVSMLWNTGDMNKEKIFPEPAALPSLQLHCNLRLTMQSEPTVLNMFVLLLLLNKMKTLMRCYKQYASWNKEV